MKKIDREHVLKMSDSFAELSGLPSSRFDMNFITQQDSKYVAVCNGMIPLAMQILMDEDGSNIRISALYPHSDEPLTYSADGIPEYFDDETISNLEGFALSYGMKYAPTYLAMRASQDTLRIALESDVLTPEKLESFSRRVVMAHVSEDEDGNLTASEEPTSKILH